MTKPKTRRAGNIIVIGASAGGVEALQQIVATLPPDLPAAVFVVLHLGTAATSSLPAILGRAGAWPVAHGVDGAEIEPGKVYIAPPDFHLLVGPGKIALSRGPRENRFRPAIDPLFRSAAIHYRNRVIGVILTGMLGDGAAGLWAIKEGGGTAVVQSDAKFDPMPTYARENVDVDHYVPLAEIPPLLGRLLLSPVASASANPIPTVIRMHHEKIEMKTTTKIDWDRVGKRSVFSCPDCNGMLWELSEGKHLQYACHVGHSFTGSILSESKNLSVEHSLWSAVRALKEAAALQEHLAERSAQNGRTAAAKVHRKNATQKHEEAKLVQSILKIPTPATDASS